MKKLLVELQYCYGIKKLKAEFVFKNRAFGIYAPNGTMKTSFTKTFIDVVNNQLSKDLAFPDRKTIRNIKIDDKDILPKTVFVIEHYNDNYQSDKISTLLANKKLKKKYDEIHKSIEKIKKEFKKEMKNLSGVSNKDIANEIKKVFNTDKDFFDILIDLEDEVNKSESNGLEKIRYKKIFVPEVLQFLEENKYEVEEYIKRYYELIDKSKYLNKDFNFYNIEIVTKQLGSNNFFKVGHSVNLYDGDTKKECNSDNALKKLIEEEKKKVLEDFELQNKFDLIDKKLSNAKLREFRDYLLEHKHVLPKLINIENFAKELWISYFVSKKDLFNKLLEEYKKGEKEIKELIKKAKKEQTDWERSIKIFNNRFTHLPFSLSVKNKDDVILKGEVPTIKFVFKDGDDEKIYINKNELLTLLSTGEQRALYILNIIFEIEARKKLDQDTLLIIDDIADSFDYKNKYAIIDYLKYISELEKFYIIILTHNFDFFRIINSRGIVSNRKQCLFALKYEDKIELEKAEYLRNPFAEVFKKKLEDPKNLIASIPFVRNIIEYTKGKENDDYLKLTSLLHIKENSESIKLKGLKDIFKNSISSLNFPENYLDKNVIDLISETAENCLNSPESGNLANKIVLSIAIRLEAEKFMIDKISDKEFIKAIESNQTLELLKEFEKRYNNEKEVLDILKRVNLITPENIHINSFMYEPLIDMGDNELKKLYEDVKKLSKFMI